jgi:hypothetical protein
MSLIAEYIVRVYRPYLTALEAGLNYIPATHTVQF